MARVSGESASGSLTLARVRSWGQGQGWPHLHPGAKLVELLLGHGAEDGVGMQRPP